VVHLGTLAAASTERTKKDTLMGGIRFRLRDDRRPASVPDFERAAQRRLPRMVWAFIASGAEDLRTFDDNRAAFARWSLRQRVLTGSSPSDASVRIGGELLELPVLLAPTGLVGLTHHSGEPGAAIGAEGAGTIAVVPMGATYTPEEVGAATTRQHAFQLYPWRRIGDDPHRLIDETLDRVAAAGYRMLFLTVDMPTAGNREVERRHGLGLNPVLTPARLLDAARHPRWSWGLVRHGRVGARLLVDRRGLRPELRSVDELYQLTFADFTWKDVVRIRQRWNGPMFIKGILDAEDAAQAVDLGADGIVVSNHGGRQLDGSVASLDALPAIAARIDGRASVLLDSGVRRGSDIVKARCLGADAVLVGRPYLFALATGGPPAVTTMLNNLREEYLRTLTLMGVDDHHELGAQHLSRTVG
jgi:L-lactate dehydrogenase (cytochrome)/(S)-mandelate dehydrogenase